MRSQLAPELYRDESVFRREMETVFPSSWQLVAFSNDLDEPDDFVVVTLDERSVVIQNFDGELRAFHNVCSHRHSRIRGVASGNGPLRCPYHGWSYNRDGVPYSIPSRPRFDAADLDCQDSLALRPYAIETCGALVFARTTIEGPPLEEFLGDAYDHVHAVGDALGERLSCYRLVVAANWKVVVENTLEGYHVNFVHAESLKRLGTSGTDFGFQGPHSTFRSGTQEKPSATRDRIDQAFSSRPLRTRDYIHQLVFPNTTIATAHGTSFNINLIRPLHAAETVIDVYVFETRLSIDLSKAERSLVKAMRPAVVELTNTAFDEDRAICEQVQLGLAEASRPAVLSSEEQRIGAFQTAYLRCLNGDT